MRALVQYTYVADAATGPGYYLYAVVPSQKSAWVRLIGMMRDTAQAGVLLQAARSLSPSVKRNAR